MQIDREKRQDLITISIIMLAIFIFFSPVLFSDNIYYFRDILFAEYPYSAIVKESFDTGSLPFWNPYIGFGQPLFASPGPRILYPTSIFRTFLSGPTALKWELVTNTCWAAIGMFLLCRKFKLSRPAALLGSLGFAFIGPFVSAFNITILISTVVWLPWVLLTLDTALSDWNIRAWLRFSLILAMQILGGEPVTIMQTLTVSFLYMIIVYGNRQRVFGRANLQMIGSFTIAVAFGIFLCALFFLPLLGYLSLGQRAQGGLTTAEANQFSLHPLSLFDLVVPGFFAAHPLTTGDNFPWTKYFNSYFVPHFISIYFGVTLFGLFLIAVVSGRDRRRLFFTFIAIITLLLALGSYLHLFDLLRWTVPIYRTMRYPVKFLFITAFAVSLMAAYGLEQLRLPVNDETLRARKRGLLITLAFALVLLLPTLYFSVLPIDLMTAGVMRLAEYIGIKNSELAAGQLIEVARPQLLRSLLLLVVPAILVGKLLSREDQRSRQIAVYAVIAIAVVELGLFNYNVNPLVKSDLATLQPDVLRYLPEPKTEYRIYCDNNNLIGGRYDAERLSQEPKLPLYYGRSNLVPNNNINYRLNTGFDQDKESIYPVQMREFMNYLRKLPRQGDDIDDQRLALLAHTNNRFIIAVQPLTERPGFKLIGKADNFSVDPTYVYELENHLPNIFIANQSRQLPTGAETLQLLADPTFPAREQVIINDSSAPQLSNSVTNGTAVSKVVTRTLNSFTVEAQLTQPGYLVVQQSYFSGWRAKVDDQPAQYYRANQIFMAVPLEAGQHQIEFTYVPRELLIGITISAITLLLGAALYWQHERITNWLVEMKIVVKPEEE